MRSKGLAPSEVMISGVAGAVMIAVFYHLGGAPATVGDYFLLAFTGQTLCLIAYLAGIYSCWHAAALYPKGSPIRLGWMAMAANCFLSTFRHLDLNPLFLPFAGSKDRVYLISQVLQLPALIFVLLGMAAMWWGVYRLGLGFRIHWLECTGIAFVAALVTWIFRNNLSRAHSPFGAVVILQEVSLVLLIAIGGASILLHGLAMQMGGGKLAVVMRCIAVYALTRSVLTLSEGARPDYPLLWWLAYYSVPWVFAFAASYFCWLTAGVKRGMRSLPFPQLIGICAVLVLALPVSAQNYSKLSLIDRSNVTKLKPAWIYHTTDVSDGKVHPTRSAFEATPLVIDNIIYVTTSFSRLAALDAETGKELWSFDPKIDLTKSANLFINRGAAYWSDGKTGRLLLGTLDGRLYSLDAKTGRPDDRFGAAGWVGLRAGVANKFPDRNYGMTSPPTIYKDLVICGSLVPDGEPLGPAGDVRAFSVRTGKLVWTFHTVAQAGEPGNETWAKDSWKNRGGVNAWAPLAIDVNRGILFLPLTSPSTDFYGGDRGGAGLYGDSLVALNATTGKLLWHFQTVHHNLWDYDLPAQPTLVTVRHDGKIIDAVAQVTKTGYTFLFDRVTGSPLFPIEEVPVPASEVPGEKAYPTQPRPVKPPPYARQKMTADELTDVTPESRAYCGKLIQGAVFGDIFTPTGLKPTVLFPGTNGGANWGGASFDPETHTLYVNSMDVGSLYHMVKRPDGSEIPYRQQGSGSPNSRFWDQDLNPCQKPPWGFLTAIDLDTGEFRWRSILGVVDKLLEKGVPPTGAPNIGGSLVTVGGLVFIGATNDSRFRAFDKDSGKELWTTRLPASAHATPVTFTGKRSGRQFVLIAAGGGNKYSNQYSDSLVAFSVPTGDANKPPLISMHDESTSTGTGGAGPAVASPTASLAVPVDPNRFSHQRHAPLKLKCTFCHTNAQSATKAAFPTASRCATCHQTGGGNARLVQHLKDLPPNQEIAPAVPVYRLPDFVFFSHALHATAKIDCAVCHGNVWNQNIIEKPAMPLKMKACVDCHKANNAITTCTVCHELSQ